MAENREDIIKIVDEINYKLMDQLGDYNTIVLEYCSNTYSEAITMMDQVLWCSEDEEREWIERQEYDPETLKMMEDAISHHLDHIPAHYEDMMVHLCKKINKLIKTLNKIKL